MSPNYIQFPSSQINSQEGSKAYYRSQVLLEKYRVLGTHGIDDVFIECNNEKSHNLETSSPHKKTPVHINKGPNLLFFPKSVILKSKKELLSNLPLKVTSLQKLGLFVFF